MTSRSIQKPRPFSALTQSQFHWVWVKREVIFQTRVRVFYRDFQTRENWWKPEAVGRELLLFSSVWKTPVKQEARVFEMAPQSAPNCKQKKKWKRKRRTQKLNRHVIFAFFRLITAQFVMKMSMFFTTKACLFQVVTIWIQWRSASSQTAEEESCWFRLPKSVQEEDSLCSPILKSTQYKDKWTVEVFRTGQAACEQKFCILDPERSVGFCRGSRVEGRISRVAGQGSRVEGRGSRVEGRGSRVEGPGNIKKS